MQRDLVGYGTRVPTGSWPGGNRLAISVVVNYEEGSEQAFANGDAAQESLTEWGQYAYPPTIRNLAMESIFEYGSRTGVWRVFQAIEAHGIPATIFACAQALEMNPEVAAHLRTSNHEVCSHGYRWEEVFRLSAEEEAAHIVQAVKSIEKTVGRAPVGWYCRYGPSERTRELIVQTGQFLYDSDSYADDSPYFVDVNGAEHLVLPYTPDVNDFRFWQANGPVKADDFTDYLIDTFEELLAESQHVPRMMSLGLHPRIIGRPGRIKSLRQFFTHVENRSGVWFATREQIARAWLDMRAAEPVGG